MSATAWSEAEVLSAAEALNVRSAESLFGAVYGFDDALNFLFATRVVLQAAELTRFGARYRAATGVKLSDPDIALDVVMAHPDSRQVIDLAMQALCIDVKFGLLKAQHFEQFGGGRVVTSAARMVRGECVLAEACRLECDMLLDRVRDLKAAG